MLANDQIVPRHGKKELHWVASATKNAVVILSDVAC
jgi:hypothetical protein